MRSCVCGSQCNCGKGCMLSLVNWWEPKLLRMYVAFDWVRFHGWELVESCKVSGATVMQVGASGYLSGCLWDGWKWKVPVAFWHFLSFIYTNINGGCQHNTGGVLGVEGLLILSDVGNFAYNWSYVQNPFIYILPLSFIILTILLSRIVYLL